MPLMVLRWSAVFIAITHIFILNVSHSEEYFNLDALEIHDSSKSSVGLVNILSAGGQPPGKYMVDIFLNGALVDKREVTFSDVDGQLSPVLTLTQLRNLGVKTDEIAQFNGMDGDTEIQSLVRYIPDAKAQFDFNRQQLLLSIPQVSLRSNPRDYVNPDQWDDGIPAILVNYNLTGERGEFNDNSGAGQQTNSQFLNLNVGANLGPWRLRNHVIYSSESKENNWDVISTYLQRDIHSLHSQFTLGDSYTDSAIFDSISFRGIQLATDDSMLPDSLRGFAPVVRGIARTNAQVTISQQGNIIYQSYVSPGAFEITDLYPLSSAGELDITVKEADGSSQNFIQPFSSLPIMQREGQVKYSITTGRYSHTSNIADAPVFTQTTLRYGLPYDSTIYGGMQLSKTYTALSFGLGHGFGHWGTVSVDATAAKTQFSENEPTSTGMAYRIQYGKTFTGTGTYFSLASYRYTTEGFYDFREAHNGIPSDEVKWNTQNRKQNRFQAVINQSLNGYGSLSFSVYEQNYWKTDDVDRTLNLSYNGNFCNVNYNIAYNSNRSAYDNYRRDNALSFNVSMPFSILTSNSRVNATYNTGSNGETLYQVGISGAVLEDNNLNYSVRKNHTTNNIRSEDGGGVSVSYNASSANANVSYSYTDMYKQVNYGVQGGIIAHPYGITLSQPLNETVVLLHAPGAENIKIKSSSGITTDKYGSAIIPYGSAYRKNRVALDTTTLSHHVDIEQSVQTVVPTRGAVVLAKFTTNIGARVLMRLKHGNHYVPFGAMVSLRNKESESILTTGIVGDEGAVYLSGVAEQGHLHIIWGDRGDQQCHTDFTLPKNTLKNAEVFDFHAQCH